MMLGFMMRPPSEPTYVNTTPNVTILTNAYNAVRTKYPTIRGYFMWEDKIAAARGWDHLSLNTIVKA